MSEKNRSEDIEISIQQISQKIKTANELVDSLAKAIEVLKDNGNTIEQSKMIIDDFKTEANGMFVDNRDNIAQMKQDTQEKLSLLGDQIEVMNQQMIQGLSAFTDTMTESFEGLLNQTTKTVEAQSTMLSEMLKSVMAVINDLSDEYRLTTKANNEILLRQNRKMLVILGILMVASLAAAVVGIVLS